VDLGLPSKDQTFLWLLIEDKLLTWNNLLKRGWQGPGLCQLCRGNEDFVFHLFVQCPFTCFVWNKIKVHYKLSIGWSGSTVFECFDLWARRNYSLSSLPAFICWFIWIERNLAIFESKSPSMEKVFFYLLLLCLAIVPRKLRNPLDVLSISCLITESLDGLMGQLN
jgi:hypothetical protein